MSFKIIKTKIQTRIPCSAISTPQPYIVQYLDTLLLKYTFSCNGIPISFELIGIAHKNIIYRDSPFMFIDCIVDFLIYEIKVGSIIDVRDGLLLGIFYCEYENYSGRLKVTEIMNEDIMIYGEKVDL